MICISKSRGCRIRKVNGGVLGRVELLKGMECWEGGVKGMEYYAVDGWNIGKV